MRKITYLLVLILLVANILLVQYAQSCDSDNPRPFCGWLRVEPIEPKQEFVPIYIDNSHSL